MLFSHVRISSFRAKAHLVFHWCLYNKHIYYIYGTTEDSVHLEITSLFWKPTFGCKKKNQTVHC